METKQNSHHCHCSTSGERKPKRKKTIVLIGIVLIAGFLALIAIKASGELSDRGDYGRGMMRGGDYPVGISSPGRNDQFIVPADALKSGEIAIVVDDLEAAQKNVAEIAASENGGVYATHISYASDRIKNGSIVVQIPEGNFSTAFASLKKVGSRVVQESTQQLPARDFYAYPQPMAAQENALASEVASEEDATEETNDSPQQTEIAPAYPITAPQLSQDKGYIRVIFVDHGKSEGRSWRLGMMGGNMLGVGYAGQNMRNNIWVVLAIKSILLIVLIAFLIVVFRKAFKNLHKGGHRKNHMHGEKEITVRKPQIRLASKKTVVHVVRQKPKTRPRVVKIAKKK